MPRAVRESLHRWRPLSPAFDVVALRPLKRRRLSPFSSSDLGPRDSSSSRCEATRRLVSCSVSGKRQRGSRDRWRYCSPPSSKASIRCHYPVRSQPLPLAEAHRRSMWGEGEGNIGILGSPRSPHRRLHRIGHWLSTRVGCGTYSTPTSHFGQSRSVFLCLPVDGRLACLLLGS